MSASTELEVITSPKGGGSGLVGVVVVDVNGGEIAAKLYCILVITMRDASGGSTFDICVFDDGDGVVRR